MSRQVFHAVNSVVALKMSFTKASKYSAVQHGAPAATTDRQKVNKQLTHASRTRLRTDKTNEQVKRTCREHPSKVRPVRMTSCGVIHYFDLEI